jgi:hypothetical protein
MPIARFQLPDGRIAKFEVAEGTTPEEAQAEIERHLASVPPASTPAPKAESPISEAETIAGTPGVRFALGSASPFLGAAQLGAEAVGSTGISENLKQLEQMKQRGMSSAGKIAQLKDSRARLAKLPGYEAQIALIDRNIAELEKAPSTTDGGVDLAGLTGTVLSPAVLGAMKIPAAGSVLGRAGQGAAVGAAFGAASPVTGGDDFWSTKATQTGAGAVIGGAIPPAIDAVKAVGGKAIDIIAPFFGGSKKRAAQILSDVLGEKRGPVEAELAKPGVIVPGSQPTAAEAASAAGSAELSGLQRNMARQLQPSQYSDIGKAQELARRASIQSFGKTETDLDAAIAARKSAADPLYKAAREAGDVVDTKPVLEKINDLLRRNPGNRELVTELMNIKKGLLNKKLPRTNAEEVASVLDGMKAAMSKEDNKFILGQLDDIKKMLGAEIPGMRQADQTFAKMSGPVNEMQVGQQLERALVKPVGEGERVAVFANAMRDEPRTVQRATDFRSFEKLEDVLKPENIGKVRGVLSDLARKAEHERLASLGSKRAGELTEAYGLPATGPLHQQYMIFKTLLGRVSKAMNEKALNEIAEALKLPQTTLQLLQSAPTKQQRQLIDRIIAQKLGRGAIAAGAELSAEGVQ